MAFKCPVNVIDVEEFVNVNSGLFVNSNRWWLTIFHADEQEFDINNRKINT